jgi:hypothetical protein
MVESMQKQTKTEIEKLKGKYDQDDFYILEEGGFYDPLGVHFNNDGIDAEGGSYDEAGFYVPAIPTYPLRQGKLPGEV